MTPDDYCKGKIYKCKMNEFINKKGEIVFQTRFTPMKSLSCSGCDRCYWARDELDELRTNKNRFNSRLITDEPEHNALYKLDITNVSRDWESGLIDDYDLKLVRVEEQNGI